MLESIKSMLGFGPKVDLGDIIANGGTILDVRSPEEYKEGHIKNSMNIPLNTLNGNLAKINKEKPVITCCASGMRSATAKSILKSNGFTEVHNGGGWTSLQRYLK